MSNGTFVCAYDHAPNYEFMSIAVVFLKRTMIQNWPFMLYVFRCLLLPLFFLYVFRPRDAEVIIHVRHEEAPVQAEEEDESDEETLLDALDQRIIEQLKKRPSGTTARMLTLAVRASYPEVELADMDDRLHALQSRGIVAVFKGQLRAPLWVSA
jgi:hypothetical protein